jgi:hypothetical protein
VTSFGNGAVLQKDAYDGPLEWLVSPGSGGLVAPVGLDFGSDGNLYVADYSKGTILRFNGDTGAFIDVFVPAGAELFNPGVIRFGPDNNLYVVNGNGEILRFDGATGASLGVYLSPRLKGFGYPDTIRFGRDGKLCWTNWPANFEYSVLRYDTSISVFIPPRSGGLYRPRGFIGLSVDIPNYLFIICDGGPVLGFRSDGTFDGVAVPATDEMKRGIDIAFGDSFE